MDNIVLLLIFSVPVVCCYSSGQVMDSCEDMLPRHSGLNPKTEPAPFIVTTDHNNYVLGKEVKVRLLGSTPFIGFLLQAKEVGGQTPMGSFTPTAGAAQLLTCSQRPNSAVSHRSDSVQTSVEVTWRPEASKEGKPIQFHASFVQNYRTFWVNITSLALTFTNDSTSGSPSPLLTTTTIELQPTPVAGTISSANCGVTKVCFSQPADCDPTVTADCYFMSAMVLSPSDTALHYEMTGPSDGYISFGFSDDQRMGNDDIYICSRDDKGQVWLQHAFSVGRTAPQPLPLGNVSDVIVSVEDRVISCSFTSMNTILTQRTQGKNKTYHLMFAHGPSTNGKIQFHAGTFISNGKIDISRPQIVGKAGWHPIIKAHGALMLIAWMTMGSLGMMVARYLKGVTKGQNLGGKDMWFLVHVALMSVAVSATIIAFILSFSHVKAWSKGAHPVLGCLVMILSFLQPILALLRCGPQHSLRFIFNGFHALNGVVIKALAVAAILTGLKLIDSTLDQWLMKVMGGFVGWEALFFFILEVHLKLKASTTETLEAKKITVVLIMALFFLGNCTFLVVLLVGIGMS